MSRFDEDDAFEGAAAAVPQSLSQRAMAGARGSGVGPRGTEYLDDLNPAQREAAEALEGPVLMLAGAGTGKTKTLMARIAHLVETGRAREREILAVTFTNKAAREMKDRLAKTPFKLGEPLRWMGTFHSISVKILRRHAELAGLKSSFTILDTDDQLRLLKQLLELHKVDVKRWPPRLIASKIDSWKNRAWTPGSVPESEDFDLEADRVYSPAEVAPTDSVRLFARRNPQSNAIGRRTITAIQIYAEYQDRLRSLNAADFGDLLLYVVEIFKAYPDLLTEYQLKFRYILVDEYQDTNVAQYLWLRLLAQGHKNICCVGDDDQSIYGWRGAEVGNILRFEKDFPGAKVIRLEQNYRSTPHILAAASSVIAQNAGRLGKTLWTEEQHGEKVRLIGHWDGEEEARWIGEEAEALQRGSSVIANRRSNARSKTSIQESERLAKGGRVSQNAAGDIHVSNLMREQSLTPEGVGNIPVPRGFGLDEMAILVRGSSQMRAFEDRFLTIGLPYRVVGGPRFYERAEIRDAMAYFRLAVSPEDDLAFERIVNTPKRGLGDKAQQVIQMTARADGTSLLEGARYAVAAGKLGGKGAAELRRFVENVDRWHKAIAAASPATARSPADDDDELIELEVASVPPAHDHAHVRLAEEILEDSGYIAMWQNDKTPEAAGRLENLKELVKALEQFDNLQGFLEHVALISENSSEGEESEKITIMTMHAAKGTEFPVVFLPGWEDGLFPSQRSMDESGQKGLEEERRLAYVGITRAEELCTISFAGNRQVYGRWQSQMPSRFIDELPEADVEVLTPPGLYGGGYGAAAGFGSSAGGSSVEARAAKADVYNSPGWRRLQDRAGNRPVSQPRESRHTVIDLDAVSAFDIGDRVFHQKFGYGHVQEIEGDKLAVAFGTGVKKIVAGFVVAAADADDVPF